MLDTYRSARRDGYGVLGAIRFAWWLHQLPRHIRRHVRRDPSSQAFERALANAARDHRAWLRSQR